MSKRKNHRSPVIQKAAGRGVSRRALMIGLGLLVGGGAVGWSLLGSSQPANAKIVVVWKSSTCSCCGGWVSYMRSKGYSVVVNNVNDPTFMKVKLGVPAGLYSCHTATIGRYTVEGHVPAAAVAKLLEEQPELSGIALPGMPAGSPGMDGPPDVYRIMGFTAEGHTRRFMDAGV